MTACFRLRVNKHWKQICCGHARINRELEEIAPETCSSSDSIIAQYVFDKNYEVFFDYDLIDRTGLLTMLS